jgi:hypothetical protein
MGSVVKRAVTVAYVVNLTCHMREHKLEALRFSIK